MIFSSTFTHTRWWFAVAASLFLFFTYTIGNRRTPAETRREIVSEGDGNLRILKKAACGDETGRKSCVDCGTGSKECSYESQSRILNPGEGQALHRTTVKATNTASANRRSNYQRKDLDAGYTGSDCNIQGPMPTVGNLIMKFFALGDVPYDRSAGVPFIGDDYDCLANSILPSMMDMAHEADYIVHIGDFKPGQANGGDPFCTDQVFGTRRALFATVEPAIDFLLVVGDNEWNECAEFDRNRTIDPAKARWRRFFANGSQSPFKNFDRSFFPSGAAPTLMRQPNFPENFFFYYSATKVAVFGVTEPAGDVFHDSINTAWVSSKLSGLPERPGAIIVFGHSSLATNVLSVLANYTVPTLFVNGNSHPAEYCMKFVGDARMFLELTVAAFITSPLLVSLVEGNGGHYFFHVDSLFKNDGSCPTYSNPKASPDNHPLCPLPVPSNLDGCSTPEDCFYEPYECPESNQLVYLKKFSCIAGKFVESDVEPSCPAPFSFCFSGDSIVEVQDRGFVPMKHLKISDRIHVGDNNFEPVYSFGHYSPTIEALFLDVKTKYASIQISADHMLFTKTHGFIPASSLHVGDKLVHGSSGNDMVVESIRTIKKSGVFAPFTPSGTIVVNDVLASSFIALEPQQHLSIAGLPVRHQWLAHMFEFPHRVACYYLTMCPNELYTNGGTSKWVAAPLEASRWVLAQHQIIRDPVLVACVGVLSFFSVLETCSLYLCAAIGAILILRATRCESKIKSS